MGAKAKFHGPPFAGLETTERLSDEQIDARVGELFGQLTQDEKIHMMSGDPPFWLGMADMMGGGYADHPWVAGAGHPRHALCGWPARGDHRWWHHLPGLYGPRGHL